MKYCIRYVHPSRYIYDVDEIIIDYYPHETGFLNFLDKHQKQVVHMRVYAENAEDFLKEEVSLLADIHAQHPEYNFYVSIPFDKFLIKALTENQIPFWIHEFISDWDMLNEYLSLGAAYVLVTHNICFEIDKVAKLVHAAGAKVRVVPNFAQSVADSLPSMQKFFIRPEDIPLYEDFVDVCDIYALERQQQDTYYKIYALDKYWFGNLREIIQNFHEDIDSRCIPSIFAMYRINCGKKCMKGGTCTRCIRYKALADTMKNNNIILKPLSN